MNAFVRLALFTCPREFRREHRDRIAADCDSAHSGRTPVFATCADLVSAGLTMRIENLARDLGFAARTLAKSPLFTIVAGGTIALAIGANIAVSSVLLSVVLRPLPFPDSQHLAFVAAGTSVYARLSGYDASSIAQETKSFSTLALARETSETYGSSTASPVALSGHLVDGNYFHLLGAHAQLGRLMDARDLSTTHMVLSFATWQHTFNADSNIVGRRVRFGDHSYEIVGVVADGFVDPAPYGLAPGAFWVPINMKSPVAFSRVWRAFYGIARLPGGVTADAAQADASRIIAQLARQDPTSFVGIRQATVVPMLATIAGQAVQLLWLLYAAVAVVLIIACANVANLNLVRAAKRERELLIRTAVGASRSRIITQLLTEATLLAGIGGVLGVGLGAAMLALMQHFAANQLPRLEAAAIDPVVVLYALGLAGACALLIGLIPALMLGRKHVRGGRNTERPAANRVRSGLVIAEVALAIAVIASAGLILRSYVTLTHVPVGFDGRGTFVVNITLPAGLYATPASYAAFLRTSTRALHTIPGVTAVAAAGPVPFITDYFIQAFSLPGRSQRFTTNKHPIGTEYFRALKIPLLRGRAFDDRDRTGSSPVVIVNARFAQQYFGTADVIGKRMQFQSFTNQPLPVSTIVGIVGNTRNYFHELPQGEVYIPVAQDTNFWHFVVRTNGDPSGFAAAVNANIHAVSPLIPRPSVTSYDDLFVRNADQPRASMVLFGLLGLIALLLAAAGVFAVTAYSVEQRTREFGIRKAIGARRFDILARVLRSALSQGVAGIVLGLVAGAFCTRLLEGLLFETSPFDPATILTVVLLLVACTVVAAFAPALRAAAIDAAAALRYE